VNVQSKKLLLKLLFTSSIFLLVFLSCLIVSATTYAMLWGDDWLPELKFGAYNTYIKFETPPSLYCDKLGVDDPVKNTRWYFYNAWMDNGTYSGWWWITVKNCNITITKWFKRFGQFEFIAEGSGTANITLYSPTKPEYVYFDNVAQTEGANWTYSIATDVLMITPTLSSGTTKTILITYISVYNPDFVDIITNAFEYFDLTDFIDSVFDMINIYADYLTISLTYIQGYIVPIFTLFANTAGWILDWFAKIVNAYIQIASTVKAILDGTASITTTWGNVWKYIELSKWEDAIPYFILIAWLVSIDNRAKKTGMGWMSVFMSDINNIISVLSFIYNLAFNVVNTVIDLVFKFLSAIPI